MRRFRVTEADLHPHLRQRMAQRGVTREEIERTLNEGWDAEDAKAGTVGNLFVFPYRAEWEGQFFEEKEVSVYYKVIGGVMILLTVKPDMANAFQEGNGSEDRIRPSEGFTLRLFRQP